MQLTQAIALFSALACTSLASDVYSYFLDHNNAPVEKSNFNVGSNGCFTVKNASFVGFSQSGNKKLAKGPYCLRAFDEGGCGKHPCRVMGQEVHDVQLDNRDKTIELEDGLRDAASYMWAKGFCG